MDREKAVELLGLIVDFYLDGHDDPQDGEEIEKAEKYIRENLK